MATNPYFNTIGYAPEQDLMDELTTETIQIHGVDIMYLPIEGMDVDPILREPTRVAYKRFFQIEVYPIDGGDLGGAQNIMSHFGLRMDKTIDFFMSRTRYQEITGRKRPLEGDLIYVGKPDAPNGSFVNALFEIKEVTFEDPEWAFGRHYVFRVSCAAYQINGDEFDTGVPVLDQFDWTGLVDGGDGRASHLETAASNRDIARAAPKVVRFNKNNPLTGL